MITASGRPRHLLSSCSALSSTETMFWIACNVVVVVLLLFLFVWRVVCVCGGGVGVGG